MGCLLGSVSVSPVPTRVSITTRYPDKTYARQKMSLYLLSNLATAQYTTSNGNPKQCYHIALTHHRRNSLVFADNYVTTSGSYCDYTPHIEEWSLLHRTSDMFAFQRLLTMRGCEDARKRRSGDGAYGQRGSSPSNRFGKQLIILEQ